MGEDAAHLAPDGGRSDGFDVVRSIGAAHDAIVAAPVLWARARGFLDVTPALLGAVLAIEDGGTTLARFTRDRNGSKQAASKLLGELHKRGYAELVSSPSDGRAKVVVLTRRGVVLRATCLEADRRLWDAVARLIGDEAPSIAARLAALATGLVGEGSEDGQ